VAGLGGEGYGRGVGRLGSHCDQLGILAYFHGTQVNLRLQRAQHPVRDKYFMSVPASADSVAWLL